MRAQSRVRKAAGKRDVIHPEPRATESGASSGATAWMSTTSTCLVFSCVLGAVCLNGFSTFSNTPARGKFRQILNVDSRKVILQDEFLPHDMATKWREQLKAEWASENRSWLYTSNTHGTGQFDRTLQNMKIRGVNNIKERKREAIAIARSGGFAYSKWELPPEHPLVKEFSSFMLRPTTKAKVAMAFNVSAKRIGNELSDLFVTLYTGGDFLSNHDDSYAGQYAFVVGLADGPEWRPEFGGALNFFCEDTRKYCQSIAPKFNSIALFKTMEPQGPMHHVAPVTEAADANKFLRFGFTGWYTDKKIPISNVAIEELNKMRGTK